MALIQLLSKVSTDLKDLQIPWALIGALAVGTYGKPALRGMWISPLLIRTLMGKIP
jgi:hypothetical protein